MRPSPSEAYPLDTVWRMCNEVRLARAGVAQLAEQLICNQPVAGSSPIASSSSFSLVGFPSGQREQTVNLSA